LNEKKDKHKNVTKKYDVNRIYQEYEALKNKQENAKLTVSEEKEVVRKIEEIEKIIPHIEPLKKVE